MFWGMALSYLRFHLGGGGSQWQGIPAVYETRGFAYLQTKLTNWWSDTFDSIPIQSCATERC